MWDIEDEADISQAILWEAIGQTFAIFGMVIAKWSLGLFLLRLVVQVWHKVVIWAAMAFLMAVSISTCFVFWLQVRSRLSVPFIGCSFNTNIKSLVCSHQSSSSAYSTDPSMRMSLSNERTTKDHCQYRCTPYEFLWDRGIPGGYCHIDTRPISTTLSSKFCTAGETRSR